MSSSRMTRSVTAAAMSDWMCSFEASGSIVPTYSSASPMSSRAHPERMASGTSSAVTTSRTPEATQRPGCPAISRLSATSPPILTPTTASVRSGAYSSSSMAVA